MTQPINQKPDNSDPKNLVFANLGGLPKFVQDMIDRNKNQIPDFLENLNLKDIQINGKTFNTWNEVMNEFKKYKQGSKPVSIKFKGKELNQKKPAGVTFEKKPKQQIDPKQAIHEKEQRPIKIGSGFTIIKILLALAAIVALIYYIYKLAS